ncbi:hypothetical protein M1M98_01760 [Thermodesulfovibrionales bacterium]|nr:hypothetical protein [Thermodesulfovibrionales bacterium]MCL0046982.1 hypothetical protein [Thermodesulfovibrionales bacterium]MCL0086950.1 hypothetical protein [Thermodesulfovibrionales bacterium]
MRHLKITSLANPILKEAIRIKKKYGKYRHEAFLIEGFHLLEMVLGSAGVEIKSVFLQKSLHLKRMGSSF